MSNLFKYLRKQQIKQLRLTWCDNANLIRAKVFSIDEIDKINQTGLRVSQAIQSLPVMGDCIIPDAKLPATQDIFLKPDWLSFNILPHTENSACVMSRMMDHAVPWSLCPRQFLMKMTQKFFEKTGLTIQIAFDHTFQIWNTPDNKLDAGHYASQRALDKFDLFLTDVFELLKTLNLQPTSFYAVSGNNRFKFLFRPSDPLAAADRQIIVRQTLQGIALKHQLQYSCLPLLSEEDQGNGGTLRFNLCQNNRNILFNTGTLSDIASHFIAGILYHLPDLMAITIANTNSLRRIKPKQGVGCYSAWGYENRETPIEIPKQVVNDSSTEILFKIIDAAANPYYAVAGLMACGLDGIEKKMHLPKPFEYDPALLAKSNNNSKALPLELGEILKSFERSPFFKDWMGDTLFSAYIAVKKAEYEFFKRKTFEEEVALLKFLF